MGYDRYRMEARSITGSQNEELQRLYAALPAAIHRAAVALQTGVPSELSGRQLEEFLEKEGEVDALMRRIQEIVGKS
jgi:hypothetical protein